ncbi:hypothetical protein RMCBS344292_05299 [Rhizopus microsporus]|nr:hypothetical protein RMCBS344292_05299 [Rhizopus microsporus]
MKEVAEEDYIFVVDKASKIERDSNYQEWALNMQQNEYRALDLAYSTDYWRWLSEKEKDEQRKDAAAVIEEIEKERTVDNVVKRVYLQVLETLLFDDYLYDKADRHTEADYVVKLFGPILENLSSFMGESKSSVYAEAGYPSRLDLRVISRCYKKDEELSIIEFAKQSQPCKYYIDKKRAVMSSWLHLKHRIKGSQLNLQDAKRLAIPFVLCEGFEADIYKIRLVDDTWTVVEKAKDMHIPSSILEIKNGEIRDLLEALNEFKENCIAVTEISSGS